MRLILSLPALKYRPRLACALYRQHWQLQYPLLALGAGSEQRGFQYRGRRQPYYSIPVAHKTPLCITALVFNSNGNSNTALVFCAHG
jgi:hypothetical protein